MRREGNKLPMDNSREIQYNTTRQVVVLLNEWMVLLLLIAKDATSDKVPKGGGAGGGGSIKCQENGTETTTLMVMQTINNSSTPSLSWELFHLFIDEWATIRKRRRSRRCFHLKDTELVGGCPKFSAPLRAVRFLSPLPLQSISSSPFPEGSGLLACELCTLSVSPYFLSNAHTSFYSVVV